MDGICFDFLVISGGVITQWVWETAVPAVLTASIPVFAEELDAAEAYNQKWLTATGYCISLCCFSSWSSSSFKARNLLRAGGSIGFYPKAGWELSKPVLSVVGFKYLSSLD